MHDNIYKVVKGLVIIPAWTFLCWLLAMVFPANIPLTTSMYVGGLWLVCLVLNRR